MPEPQSKAMVGVYWRWQWYTAILLAAFWGWAFIAGFDAVGYTMTGRVEQGLGRLFLLAVVGLPIAVVVSFVFVGPALLFLIRQRIRFLRAAIWGAGVSTAIATLSIIRGRYVGWKISLDDSRYSQIGGGDYIRSIDGILTPYGWQVLAQNTAAFIAWCTIGALLISLVIGPGRSELS